ncbi:phage/plasmid primase, P4 family [Paenibacillus sp. YIM B09110]|uniref:phage/plasmid primase, P4 family n=1 Tax=Paenibacillus sp. YIM B09110 TaxID=3126102 RepID=UPI00301C678E
MSIEIKNIPDELKQRAQWILWKLEKRKPKDEKPTKVPYGVDGRRASADKPETWASFQEALGALQRAPAVYKGLGFVFSTDDPFTGVDLDSDLDKTGFACMHDGGLLGDLTEEAKAIINELNSYTEYSQSGTGIHILVRAAKPGDKCKRMDNANFEMYDRERFFVVTGRHIAGTPHTIEPRQSEVDRLYSRFLGDVKATEKGSELPQLRSPQMDDESIISIAQHSGSADKFNALYVNGDVHRFHGGDESAADQGLCNMLAFYTQDPEQIDRLFRQSALLREKWERDDYREITIQKAIRDLTAWCGVHSFDSGDKGNAERFIYHFGSHMRYCKPFDHWLIWDGQRWKRDNNSESVKLAMTIAERIDREEYGSLWNSLTDGQRNAIQLFPKKDLSPELLKLKSKLDGLRKQSERAKSGSGIREMLKLAEPYLAVAPDELDADEWLLNVNNGILDLRTGFLQPHDSARLMSKLVPVDYVPGAACPQWDKALNDIFEDESQLPRSEELRYLQKALGYALTGSVKEHAFFIMHGRRGRNGKGVIFNTVAAILGDYVEHIPPDVLLAKKLESGGGPTPSIAKLKGARLVLASETDRGRRLDEALIKGLTGGDPITARFLNQNDFTFKPAFKIFLQTNYMPNVDGSDDGIWDRIKKLDFLRYFEEHERDTQLEEKLQQEKVGILAWLVRGCLQWQVEGLRETEEMRKSKADTIGDMDVIPVYAREHLLLNPLASVGPVELYRHYGMWCIENAEYTHRKKEFFQRLEAFMARQGYTLHKNEKDSTRTKRVLKGVGLKPNPAGRQQSGAGFTFGAS